jgi:putative CocE/NonD family hydrolase
MSDESPVEDRRDVLCFTSAPLREAIVVTGAASLRLRTRADVDTHDVVASLTDVAPNERSIRITTGSRRLRRVAPGDLNDAEVQLAPTSWLVPEGHRLRLDISASRFPAYARNPQRAAVAAHRAGRDDCRVATIEIFDVQLELPVEG